MLLCGWGREAIRYQERLLNYKAFQSVSQSSLFCSIGILFRTCLRGCGGKTSRCLQTALCTERVRQQRLKLNNKILSHTPVSAHSFSSITHVITYQHCPSVIYSGRQYSLSTEKLFTLMPVCLEYLYSTFLPYGTN